MSNGTGELQRRQMFAEIKKLCADNFTNWFTIAREYIVFAVTVATCLAAYRFCESRGWSIWWMLPVYVVGVAIIGGWVQNRLSVLVHEASHYLLFKNRVLNDLAANLFLLFPVYGTIANYRIGHWGHHRHVNDPENDPDLHRLVKHHARKFPISKRRFFWEYVVSELLPHRGISYLIGRALYVAVPMKSEAIQGHDALGRRFVFPMRMAYMIGLFTILTLYDWWPHYFLFWVAPFVTFYPAVLFLREIAHHGNYPDDGDFTNSRYYRASWLERQVFFPFGEHNHVLHHMFPTIPHHKMDEAHAVMMRYPPYRDTVVTCNGFFVKADAHADEPTVLDVLAAPSGTYLRDGGAPGERDDIRSETVTEVGALIPTDERDA